MTWNHWLGLGSLFSGLGVMLGAFAAHALKERLSPADLAIFETAVRYQMYHGLALLGVAFAASRSEHLLVKISGFAFAVGIVLFSGSLYLLLASGQRSLGAVTPFGGVSLIVGWLCLCLVAFSTLNS